MLKANQSDLIKYSDTNFTSAAVGSGTILSSLTMPSTGTGETNMNGGSIKTVKFDVRYIVNDVPSVANDFYQHRFILVQAIGAQTLTAAEILQNVSSGSLALVSPYRYDTVNRTFRVLHDSTSWVDDYNTTVTKQFSANAKVHNMRYDTVGADWATGQPYVLQVVRSSGLASDLTTVNYVRMWFYDV